MHENEISKVIVDSAIEVHRVLGGPGLLEGVYEESLVEELVRRGLKVERQLFVPIIYKGKQLGMPLRLDLKINELVLIDNKAVSDWNPIFEAQMLTYLRLTKLKLGLVINFGEQNVKNGIRRVVNGVCSFLRLCPLRLCVKIFKNEERTKTDHCGKLEDEQDGRRDCDLGG